MSWIPITPGGSILAHLESPTEDEAWDALMSEASHMPYRTRQDFEQRGYTVGETENDDEC